MDIKIVLELTYAVSVVQTAPSEKYNKNKNKVIELEVIRNIWNMMFSQIDNYIIFFMFPLEYFWWSWLGTCRVSEDLQSEFFLFLNLDSKF